MESPSRDPSDDFAWAALVPELLVADVRRSVRFWCDLIGFTVAYARAAEGFAYLRLGGAQIMLEQRNEASRQWVTGDLEPPLGRGVNLQIAVARVDDVVARLGDAGWPLFMGPEQKWYRTGLLEAGQRQFLVQDPDGYLLRLAEDLGSRPAR